MGWTMTPAPLLPRVRFKVQNSRSDCLYPGIHPGKMIVCALAYVCKKCTTCCMSANDVVFTGRLLVLPCTRGERPDFKSLASRFFNLFSDTACRKRNVFLYTMMTWCVILV